MPPHYYYHLKFELYPTPDPADNKDHIRTDHSSERRGDIWVPSPGATIFDDLPSHPRCPEPTLPRWASYAEDNSDHYIRNSDRATRAYAAAAATNSRVIDCGGQRGKSHDSGDNGRNVVRLSERQYRARTQSPPPSVSDGIGPRTAVRDWRFGKISIESFDPVREHQEQDERRMKNMAGKEEGEASSAMPTAPTPAASLGPNLGGAGQATKARYVPLATKSTQAGWGIVHLYREGDDLSAAEELPEVQDGPQEGETQGTGGSGGDEEGTVLCILAVPSYMSPNDFLGFIGERWRGDVSHYRMIMTSRMSRYMVLMKFRDAGRAKQWRKEFDGKPFDSVEVRYLHLSDAPEAHIADFWMHRLRSATLRSSSRSRSRRRLGQAGKGKRPRATFWLRLLSTR
jgi:BRCA1-associated protein